MPLSDVRTAIAKWIDPEYQELCDDFERVCTIKESFRDMWSEQKAKAEKLAKRIAAFDGYFSKRAVGIHTDGGNGEHRQTNMVKGQCTVDGMVRAFGGG